MSGQRKTPPQLTQQERLAHPRVCRKHRTNGDPCRAFSIAGADYCKAHGGQTPGGKAAAQKRLLEAADSAAAVLVEIMSDPKVATNERWRAAIALIDRVGLSPRQVVEMDVTNHDGDSALDRMLADLLSRPVIDDQRSS